MTFLMQGNLSLLQQINHEVQKIIYIRLVQKFQLQIFMVDCGGKWALDTGVIGTSLIF